MKNERMLSKIVAALFMLLFAVTSAYAEVPQTVNYQGYLTNADGAVDGTVQMTFRIYDDTGLLLWEETHSSITVNQGVYSVVFGSVDPAGNPLNLAFDAQYELGISVGTDEEMTPRQQFASVPYAFRAAVSGSAETETDPKVGSLTDGMWCTSNGAKINCTSSAPVLIEADPTVPGSIKDGIAWGEVTGRPAGLDDGDDVGITTETDPSVNTLGKASLSCSENQVAKWNGSVWACAADNGAGTAYFAGSGLNLSGTTFGLAVPIVQESSDGNGTLRVKNTGNNNYSRLVSNWEAVFGHAASGRGVVGWSDNGDGVLGKNNATGNYGIIGSADYGVHGVAEDGIAVYGKNNTSGTSGYLGADSHGVSGYGGSSGVYGMSSSGDGLYGLSSTGYGVHGYGILSHGVYGETMSTDAGKAGVYAVNYGAGPGLYASGTLAAQFNGNVQILSRTTGATIVEFGEGLDYAEGFDVSDEEIVKPGSVMVIDPEHPGKLAMSDKPYDRRVAGIIAGANGLGSAVRLGTGSFDHDVALAGRVYCNVDAAERDIEPGDLLTTSSTPGYAMVVRDHNRAQGAILGKAMEKIEKGRKGQILVLVTLQ